MRPEIRSRGGVVVGAASLLHIGQKEQPIVFHAYPLLRAFIGGLCSLTHPLLLPLHQNWKIMDLVAF
jgi:hypothetical protein